MGLTTLWFAPWPLLTGEDGGELLLGRTWCSGSALEGRTVSIPMWSTSLACRTGARRKKTRRRGNVRSLQYEAMGGGGKGVDVL